MEHSELPVITQARLKELFEYNPETGNLLRIKAVLGGGKVGDIAGTKCLGYLRVMIDGRQWFCHRLAWLYMTGEWPEQIDHIDHIKDNNRWANLRDVSHLENQKNRKANKNNTSGVCGVSWCERDKKWRARIKLNSKTRHVGQSPDKFEAICARKSAENKYGFHANHGAERKQAEES